MAKKPGFTAIALLTLAIGIGANTTMLSISDLLLLLRPKGIKAPEQLAFCAIHGARYDAFHHSGYRTLRNSGLAFSDVMAQTRGLGGTTLVHDDLAWEVRPLYVSANYFTFLGVTPAMGRGFLPAEEQAGSAPVAVLGHRLWRRLGGNPKSISAFLSINGAECQIVGVAPEGFSGAALFCPDLWLSMGSYRALSTWYKTHPPRANATDGR